MGLYQSLLIYSFCIFVIYLHQKKKSDDIDELRLILNQREIKIKELLNSENQLLIKKSELIITS